MHIRIEWAVTLLLFTKLVTLTAAMRSKAPPHKSTWDEFSSAGLHIPHGTLWKNLQMPAIVDLLFSDALANYSVVNPTTVRLELPSGESFRLTQLHTDPVYHYVTLRATHISANSIIPSFRPSSLVFHAQARPYADHIATASLLHIAFSVRANSPSAKLREARFALLALLQTGHDGARMQTRPFPCNAHFRSYSGTCNNVAEPRWGACHAALKRLGDPRRNPMYKPGTNDMTVRDLPNPRRISRTLCRQTKSMPSRRRVSALAVYWGQFIDHDMGITPDSADTGFKQSMDIPVTDKRDPFYKRHGGRLSFARSVGVRHARPCCGHGMAEPVPRAALNEQSGYIDGSHIYGCSRPRVNALRMWKGGALRPGHKARNGQHMLPLNDESDIGIRLDRDGERSDFVAGDKRANEQPILTSLHTMFMREHNRIAAKLRVKFACWKDEKVFQYSRRIVSAQIQLLTYEQFLPTILGNVRTLPPYRGYKRRVDASISAFFSTTAFRFGHSMVPDQLILRESRNVAHPRSGIRLHETFFNPSFVRQIGVEPFVLGASHQVAERVDIKVVNSLQNELFRKLTKGTDLITLNIQRNRDHGIPLYNDAREMYGLKRKRGFKDVTKNKKLAMLLKKLYKSVDRLESYIGGLCEAHVKGSELGELFHAALVEQFTRLRDGDRFFYLRLKWPKEMKNMPEVMEVQRQKKFKLSDVFVRNSGGKLKGDDFANNAFRVA